MTQKQNYVWLFGENLGNTMNNNSWYFFEHIITNKKLGVSAYFVISRNSVNRRCVRRLPPAVRQMIVWKNSLKHFMVYVNADMQFVTQSYRDVIPSMFKDRQRIVRPIVYLQHGTIAIKKLQYTGQSYNNAIFKFMTYSKGEADLLREHNNFSSYQLMYSNALPRYKELVNRNDRTTQKDQIIWFLTWREYLESGQVSIGEFNESILEVLSDSRLARHLKDNKVKLKLCLHPLFSIKGLSDSIPDYIKNSIDIVHANNVDLIDEIAASQSLITDYSSLGFDFTFLKKPVYIYQFDSAMYSANRDFYCDIDRDFIDMKAQTKDELIEQIVSGRASLNRFFTSRLEDNVNMDDIRKGVHIDKIFDELYHAQGNKLTFVGYNFYGRGGTVSATKSLAEGFAEIGYMVDFVSLKRTPGRVSFPNGIISHFFSDNSKTITQRIKRRGFRWKSNLSYLDKDPSRDQLIPYTGFALRRYLKSTKSRTVVSTRETIHLFLMNTYNPTIKNRVYYFHTSPDIINNTFPDVLDLIKEQPLDIAAFVSEDSRRNYNQQLSLSNYRQSVVTGNSLTSGEVIDNSDVLQCTNKGVLHGITLIRISKDRWSDLLNIIEYGNYLKHRKKGDIVISIFGGGDKVYEFTREINRNGLQNILKFRGLTTDPHLEIRQHDFLVDFSSYHSFGMVYMEAILNGKLCFATRNTGSEYVLRGLDLIYENHKHLTEMILEVPFVERDRLIRNYKVIGDRFSRKKVASKLAKILK